MRNPGIGLTAAFLMLCLYVVPQAAEDPSLVLYFDFEDGEGDTVEDRSMYGNHGNIQGNAIWANGKYGAGLEIDKTSFVLVPDCDEFKITDELTLACWAKCSAFAPEAWQGNSLDFLVCRWNWAEGDNRCYEMYLRSHAPAFAVSSDGTDGGSTSTASEEPVELGQWYNIVSVFDGSKVKIYVDGEEKGSADHAGNIFAGEGPIIIGDNNLGSATDYHFVGVIDEVAVYNRALGQVEIKRAMESGHTFAVEYEAKLATTWGDVKVRY
jgi:hypothetical protein